MGKDVVIFGDKRIRRVWHDEDWYYSVVDVVGVLSGSLNARDYWYRVKSRELENGIQLSTVCRQLKLKASDGKMRETDCADKEGIFRIIQSIPSKRAEPFKLWLAKVGSERVEEIENPELAQKRMKELYKEKGYSNDWIEKRVRGIAVRNELTDEWKNRGVENEAGFAILTNDIMKAAFGKTVGEYKKHKGLDKNNLRDHMDDMELIFTMLGEASTIRLTTDRDSKGVFKLRKDAQDGGDVAGNARRGFENTLGKSVISEDNYIDDSESGKRKRALG